jgi:predicted metal-dependent RNase
MYLEFSGAADEVTGSQHRVHVGGVDILLDCGLVQGHRAEANRQNRELPEWAVRAHALVLSHAHLDHSGIRDFDFWRGAFHPEFLADEGLIAHEDLKLISYAETADEIWQVIRSFYRQP